MKVTVTVELKPSVLDPEGKAIQHSLTALGFGGVEDVRAGKVFRITLNSDAPQDQIEQQVRQMCERLLANTVVESYSFVFDS
jgi:phosphoribosylformylglycinamidine synthase subunit PurS